MVVNLKHGFDDIIEKSDWMDSDTKKAARKKLGLMRAYISHPEWLSNISSVNEYYEDVRFCFLYFRFSSQQVS